MSFALIEKGDFHKCPEIILQEKWSENHINTKAIKFSAMIVLGNSYWKVVPYMRLSRQFQARFFFHERISRAQKPPKRKTNDFHPLRSFSAHKKCCLCCLMLVYFCFLSWFLLVSVFVRAKSFCKNKRKNRLEIVLITSYTILLLTCTAINQSINNLFVPTNFYLWPSVIFQAFMKCVSGFFLNKVALNSLNSVVAFTPLVALDSLPSIFFIEYIFDFNPTKSSIIFPSDSSFILPITFFLVRSKKFESSG